MLRLTDDETDVLLKTGVNNRQFTLLLDKLRSHEVEQTLLSTKDHFDTHKGRVQMLTEILKQMAPDRNLSEERART